MSETPALQVGRVIPQQPCVQLIRDILIYIYFKKKENWLSEKVTILFCKGLHSGYIATGAKEVFLQFLLPHSQQQEICRISIFAVENGACTSELGEVLVNT